LGLVLSDHDDRDTLTVLSIKPKDTARRGAREEFARFACLVP
jgi:hypothetical protein